MLKILHLAAMNFAGVPYDFYKMHLAAGDVSRIVTYHKNFQGFPEDICLNFPLPNFSLAKAWRRKKVISRENEKITTVAYFKPKNIAEEFYFRYSDFSRKSKVNSLIENERLDDFQIIHYDSGMDFYRNSEQAYKWKKEGKKIICCYYGSDLRTRGLIRQMDELSDLNITPEYDLISLKKDLHYIFYPYDPSELPEPKINESGSLRIVHSPTNRKFKGTDLIIRVIEKIKKEKKIDFILLENMNRSKVLDIKSACDISIDQVGGTMGGTGYGKAGLETLAMGIPTITNMTKEFEQWLPENPFIVANNENELYNKLNELIISSEYRKSAGKAGRQWVEKFHSPACVNKQLYELYKKNGIIH
jgi:glycosyltransferase involved in cell wall biosynthesis